jgi:hypothetical protein
MQLLKKRHRLSESEKEKLYSTADNLFKAAESNISSTRVSVLDSDVLPTITKNVSSNDGVDHCFVVPEFTVSSNPNSGSDFGGLVSQLSSSLSLFDSEEETTPSTERNEKVSTSMNYEVGNHKAPLVRTNLITSRNFSLHFLILE